jgi:PemK-like, MazF-like toxin of type II toxin-antitoxin system
MTYNPISDGDPDPGEVVWTWVPYVENDGRGKDRPVLVVAAERSGTFLTVQLTSKPHPEAGYVSLGSGGWDGENRPSWANLTRVLRVHAQGMRRESVALDAAPFGRVVAALQSRYGWS